MSIEKRTKKSKVCISVLTLKYQFRVSFRVDCFRGGFLFYLSFERRRSIYSTDKNDD